MPRLDLLIQKLKDFGLSAEQVLEVVDLVSKPSAAAVKQARYRARLKEKSVTRYVTENVTCYVTSDVTHGPPPSPSPSPLSDGFPPSPYSNTIYPPSFTLSSTPFSPPPPVDNFPEFWKIYPRKTGKGAAEKAWRRATKIADAETILGAVRGHRFSDEPEFIPHPSTWLNQRRWEDEQSAPRMTLAQELALSAAECPSEVIELSSYRRNL